MSQMSSPDVSYSEDYDAHSHLSETIVQRQSQDSETSGATFRSQDTTLRHPCTPSQDLHASKALDILKEYERSSHSRSVSDGLINFALSPPSEKDDVDNAEPGASVLYAPAALSLTSHMSAPASSRTRKQLNVVDQKHGDSKLLYMTARPNHFSYGRDSPLWNFILPADVRLLELELRHALKPKYARDPKKDVVDYLRVAMGHMLERIVYWDRDAAIKFEKENDAKALSMLPLLEDSDQGRMRHMIEKFRAAIRKLKHSDWRRFWADLDEEILQQLVRFTFLHARPVLAWELDFEEIG